MLLNNHPIVTNVHPPPVKNQVSLPHRASYYWDTFPPPMLSHIYAVADSSINVAVVLPYELFQ